METRKHPSSEPGQEPGQGKRVRAGSSRGRKKQEKHLWIALTALVFWIIVWQAVYQLIGNDLLVASPDAVRVRLLELLASAGFWQIIFRSFLRIMAGFLLGTGVGILTGILTAFSPVWYHMLRIPMSVIKATPVASFVMLAFVWISGANLSIFICFLVVLPVVWSGTDTGLRCVRHEMKEVCEVFRFPFGTKVRVLYVPAVRPHLVSALQTAIGFAWKAGAAAEVIASPAGTIGRQLHDAKVYLNTVDLFTWTLVVILLSFLIEKGLTALLKMLFGRRGTGRETTGRQLSVLADPENEKEYRP